MANLFITPTAPLSPGDRKLGVKMRVGGLRKKFTPPAPATPVIGVCEHDGKRFYASRVPGDDALTLCVPTDKGILIRTDSQIIPTGQVKFTIVPGAVVEPGKVSPFELIPEIVLDGKMVTVKDENKRVIDYQDVKVSGLASDFHDDRDNEFVVPGAFKKTLAQFRTNPVMLVDHVNSVRNVAGSFSRVREGSDGLQVEGLLSNAPELRSIRFLVAEKHLRGFSIGGYMKFSASDYRAIEEVSLFEISIVAIPANPRTLMQTRALDLDTAKKAFNLMH